MDRDNVPKSPLPHVTTHQAVVMATRLFDLQVTAVEDLSSFDDKNFYLRGTLKAQEERNVLSSNKEFILKIANEVDSSDECFIATQLGVMTFLNARGFKCSTPVPSVLGTPYVMCKIPRRDYPGVIALETNGVHRAPEIYNGEAYSEDVFVICAVRLLNYVPGKVLKQTSLSNKVLFEVGKAVGRMNRELKEFECLTLTRSDFLWDMSRAGDAVEEYLEAVSENHYIEMVQEICHNFRKEVLPKLHLLPKQLIHGDLNQGNILILPSENGKTAHDIGFIDFGFLNYSCRIFDVAVALMHILNEEVSLELSFGRIRMAKYFLNGYQSVNPLSNEEISLLPVLVISRFCQSLVYRTYLSKPVNPDDKMDLAIRNGWKNLEVLWKIPREEILNTWSQVNDEN